MLRNFTFVLQGKLAGCAHPGWGDDLRTALADLSSRHGISAIVTLDTKPLPKDLLAEYGIKGHHMSVQDFGVPSLESASEAVGFVRREIDAGGRVVVHCAAGYGRTGMLLACCLVAEGSTPEEAVAQVRRLRPGSIETHEQEEFVKRWARSLRDPETRSQD
ncbi:dual specificity protein phosphatase family protein [Candidatus Sumerlaeota bacterium]|nr:dual specificity protein phosphatase family protein [Candidatus Sumerlaeota bacterium]